MRPDTQFVRIAAGCLLAALACAGQETVAPSTESVGKPQGTDWRNYNFTTSFETGYRFNRVSGSADQYRGMVNFGNGIRLLNGFLGLHSSQGHGRYFDDLTLSAQGLGGDPYQSASLRIGKNRLYRYDLMWRMNDYVNPGLTTGGATGTHALNTSYNMQDHDLTLLPESNLRFFLGYSRAVETGVGVSTAQSFADPSAFPTLVNLKWERNEYRVGSEIRLGGMVLNWMRGWEDFKDDSASQGPQAQSTDPYHGTSPYWRVSLIFRRRFVDVNGRFTYSSPRRAYSALESAVQSAPPGAAQSREVVSFGDARRPAATGNLTVNLFPSSRIGVVNQTSVYNFRTEGNNAYAEVLNGQATSYFYYQYLGILTIANRTDVSYRPTRALRLHGGYEYSERRIRSIQQVSFAGPASGPFFEQTNSLHTGEFGAAWTGPKGLSAMVDAEIGRTDRPFAPKSDAAYQGGAARIRYNTRKLQLSASARLDYNDNSTSVTAYSSHAQTYSGSASWTLSSRFGLDATYSRIRLNTVGGIAYFVNQQLAGGHQSYYVSDIHSGTLGIHSAWTKRVDMFLGYSIVRDAGDGRSSAAAPAIGSGLVDFAAVQTFPIQYQSPLARVSVRLAEKLRWNFGYQRYGYSADFFSQQNFRANIGYTSLQWSF